MSKENVDSFLEHHGILGMKWGKRKDRTTPRGTSESGGASRVASRTANIDSNGKVVKPSDIKKPNIGDKLTLPSGKTGTITKSDIVNGRIMIEVNAKKATDFLSDEEIKSRVSRLQLEKQYSQLLAENSAAPSTNSGSTKNGKKFLTDIVQSSGKTAAKTILTAAMLYTGKKALTLAVGDKVSKEMFNKNQEQSSKK